MDSLVSEIAPFFDDPRIISAAIFGSVARGDEGRASDVDLLIISDDREFANECAAKAMATTLSRFGSRGVSVDSGEEEVPTRSRRRP